MIREDRKTEFWNKKDQNDVIAAPGSYNLPIIAAKSHHNHG